MKNMRIVNVHMPVVYLKKIDEMVRDGIFPSRSEAIRVAVREMLGAEKRLVKVLNYEELLKLLGEELLREKGGVEA